MTVGPEVWLVIMMITPNGYVHQVKQVTGHGYYNYQFCMEYARHMRVLHKDRYEIVNIGCPYQRTPTE